MDRSSTAVLSRILLLAATVCLLPNLTGVAEEAKTPDFVSSPRRLLTAPELKEAPDEWVDRSLRWVNYILARYEPTVPEHPVRRAALIRLDDILHIQSAPGNALVQAFYRERMEKAIADITASHVQQGMRIWKLYNMGFLVRTPSVSIAFDIVPGPPLRNSSDFAVSTNLIQRLVGEADVLFISHEHSDHANQAVSGMFLEAGKPVVAPEGLWTNVAFFSSRMIYPKRDTGTVQEIRVHGGEQILKVVAYPGHQGKLINNVYAITTPEQFTVVHTGDQSGADGPGTDWDWISNIGRDHVVDVLLPNCWGNALGRTLRGVNPNLVLTGHENEMSHTVDHREDYTQTYNHLFGTHYPAAVMAWGEAFQYAR